MFLLFLSPASPLTQKAKGGNWDVGKFQKKKSWFLLHSLQTTGMSERTSLPPNQPEKFLKIPSRNINLWPEVVPLGEQELMLQFLEGLLGTHRVFLGRSCDSHPPHDYSMENPWSLDWPRTLCSESPWEGQNSRNWALSAIQTFRSLPVLAEQWK